jgi:hypothetical protein
MSRDPTLAGLAIADADERIPVIELTEAGQALARYGDDDPVGSWLLHWRTLWPKGDPKSAALDELADIVVASLNSVRPIGPDSYRSLESRMLRLMRRHINQPVVAFCHLSLTALQLYRLRYGLIQRALFNDVATEEPS